MPCASYWITEARRAVAQVIRDPEAMRGLVERAKSDGRTVGLVPTMGYFHEGHLELMRMAGSECDLVVVSVYVNPTQFGPSEDFKQYPRDLERDIKLAEGAGVDYLFVPSDQDMYPEGFQTYVEVEKVTRGLCGAARPGHFRGVTTVVAKLFNIIPAHRAYFGQKDAQQAAVIKRMVKDLNFLLKIRVGPTVRESDGLAMSSRNRYLGPEARKAATVLYRALRRVQGAVEAGERRAESLKRMIEKEISSEPSVELEYIAICDNIGLKEQKRLEGEVLVALAAKVGGVRLIDNVLLRVSDG